MTTSEKENLSEGPGAGISNRASEDALSSSPFDRNGKPSGTRFWIIMAALMLAFTISTLDGAVVSTALPTIVHSFDIGAGYVWVNNIYFLTTAAIQPFLGQLSDLWGRRWVFIGTVALFLLGSGIIGGATSSAMLIAGRGVQGLGAGGVNMMVELIISDLMPLRERGTYLGLLFAVSSTVSAAGPVISGALAAGNQWRWIWYLNLPIGGLSLVMSVIWLSLARPRSDKSLKQQILSIDWLGAALVAASTVAILWAIAYGGASKLWSDGGVIAALVTGFVGLGLFIIWQGMPQCKNPIAPLRLFANRTSAVAFFLAFSNTIVIYWPLFMLPLYFQSVRNVSPKESGIQLLPFAFFFPVGAAFGGAMMAKTGRYKPFHLVAFALCTLSFGLCSILNRNSHKALHVIFEILAALGIGIPVACLLPPVQAPLKDSDTAVSTATFAFIRSFGSIWGLAIPAAIFNNRFSQLLHTIEDDTARSMLANGKAYELASAKFSAQFTGRTGDQVIAVYTASLQRTWQIAVVFAGFSFLAALCEKEIPLRQDLETDYGIEGNVEKAQPKQTDEDASIRVASA
ncbi:putative major Facilitator Superfamily protein [Rosellinia necatrix]|uniref:Putative major Facilitator Superfamily protein n=1 Tax=Rosellinia necatrix TaxID=77044 RepID=A0A1S7UKF2_ROSNE|nr:putative major Facilitator Superfamily protein [Rosellinia necatrix]